MINLILFCFGTASLTMFLDKCFEKGMIFRKYYNWITYWFYLERKKVGKVLIPYKPRWSACPTLEISMCDMAGSMNSPKIIIRPRFIKNKYIWLYKILGGCPYCFGTWIFVLFFFLLRLETLQFGLFLGIGINYVFIKGIEKL
jgi:hypothetical protein